MAGLNTETNEKQYDINMLFVLFLFAVVSCLYIFYAQQMPQYSENFAVRQLIFYFVAFGLAIAVLHFDFEYYANISWVLYGIGLLMLLVLELAPQSIAPTIAGAVRWFRVPVIGSFQPSELVKIFLIITLSTVIYKHNLNKTENSLKADFWLLAKMILIIIPPVFLLQRQPDMGMVMMTAAIFVSLILVSGISYKLVSVIIGGPILMIIGFIAAFFRFPHLVEQYFFSNISDYQVRRFYGWLNPAEFSDEGYHTMQAMTAIGSGRLYGNPEADVYIPEAHTDFIFAVIGGEHGFLGAAFVITLYFVLLYQIMMTALRCHNSFGTYLCAGIIGMLAFQVFQNVGMNLGLLPVTGFTLPLLSYGGSSLMATMFAIGIVLSVRYHSKTYFFDSNKQ
ncbi:FtsW/RodA/SpoVE family cell cycle protein [Bacillus sp. FJAT-44742]|uniref:FtsW/RodA/SpoVE family cell cycle protein n=1 Tax=Bacillus sp. FJAT-44742 TaxID=2014005 RepID=UPI000C24335B|nr:FtsW/RodA/SpoVE family cell cycle protein [Bacillus sp. FJAT-44742]